MKPVKLHIVTGLLASVVLATAFCIQAETEARKKARYYYSAGVVEKAQSNDAQAHEYFKKAWQIDPSFTEAAIEYGMGRLEIPIDTLQSETELHNSLEMIRSFVDMYPGDIDEAQNYGYIATQVGDIPEAVRVLERAYDMHPEVTTTLLQLSDAYARDADLGKAIDALDRYEKAEGLSPQVTTRKLSYLLADKDTVRALHEADRLIASDEGNVSYRILKGNVYDILEKSDSALLQYKEAEKVDPESGLPKLALAEYYKQLGDSVAYHDKIYEVLLCEDIDLDTKADHLAQYLQSLMENKTEIEKGDKLFSILQSQYPHEARLLDLSARYSAAKGDLKKAEEQISYALDRDPVNVTYWGQLMTYQSAQGDYDRSLATYEEVKKHVEPDYTLRLYYSAVAQQAKRYDLAAGVYIDMIHEIQDNLEPDSVLKLSDLRRNITEGELDVLSRLMASLGDVYHEAGEKERSYRMYDNALTLNPGNSMAGNNYAYFLTIEGGDLDKALALSKKVIDGEEGDNPTYLDTYAWIHYMRGNYGEAEEIQQKAVEADEKEGANNAELYVHLGDIKAKLGKREEALENWKKAVRIMKEEEETEEESYQETLNKIKEEEGKPATSTTK